MLQLLCLVGLRNGEVVHLKWEDVKTHDDVVRLHIRGRDGWLPKTGERLAPIYYPEVAEMLQQWRAETTLGNRDDDWVFGSRGKGGRPYEEVPKKWISGLVREAGVKFTPLICRHTACSLFPLYVKRLTGREFSPLEHAQVFGHDFKTSQRFYITGSLIDLAAKEGLDSQSAEFGSSDDPPDPDKHDTSGKRLEPDGALAPARAKSYLTALMKLTNTSAVALGGLIGISDVAIGKFVRQGKAVPLWWYRAMDALTSGLAAATPAASPGTPPEA
jgi:hypothetical protein